MASGSFYLENSTNLRAKVEWSTSGSRLTATLYVKKINATQPTTTTWYGEITIGSSTDEFQWWGLIGTEYVEVHSYSKTVSGNTVYIHAEVYVPSSSTSALAGQSCAGSDTVTISTSEPDPEPEPDPDPSTILTAQNVKFGEATRITWVPNSASYYFKLLLACGSLTKAYSGIYPGSTSMATYNASVPYDFISAVSSGLTGTVTITLTTHTGSSCTSSNQVGSASTATISCTIPDDDKTKPQVTAASFIPSPNPFDGAYIQNQTGASMTAITASGRYGASIQSKFFRLEGRAYSMGTVSDTIAQFGQITVTAFAVDSRGFTSKGYPVTIDVLAYSKPKLRPIEGQFRATAIRCNEDGTTYAKGAYLIIMAKREYSPVIFNGVQKNFCSIRYRYKPDTASSWSAWTTILAGSTAADSVTTTPLLGSLAPTSTYQVDIEAIDTLEGRASTIVTVSSEKVYDHCHGLLGSYAFGKYVQLPDVFEIAEDKTFILHGSMQLEGEAFRYLFDMMHPIGSVLESVNNENPGDNLGGTWVLMESTESSTKWRRTE